MTAPSSIDPARFLHDQLASASPDLLRSMLTNPEAASVASVGLARYHAQIAAVIPADDASLRAAVSLAACQLAAGTSAWATWPRACTPASVRPATVSSGGSGRPSAQPRACCTASWTVRCPGWRLHP